MKNVIILNVAKLQNYLSDTILGTVAFGKDWETLHVLLVSCLSQSLVPNFLATSWFLSFSPNLPHSPFLPQGASPLPPVQKLVASHHETWPLIQFLTTLMVWSRSPIFFLVSCFYTWWFWGSRQISRVRLIQCWRKSCWSDNQGLRKMFWKI